MIQNATSVELTMGWWNPFFSTLFAESLKDWLVGFLLDCRERQLRGSRCARG
jgi:hypothetical protein